MVRLPRSTYDDNDGHPPDDTSVNNNNSETEEGFDVKNIFTFSFLFRKLIPYSILFVSAYFFGWLGTNCPMWEGKFHATLFPLLYGQLPSIIFGHGRMNNTSTVPPVPDDLYPLSRPVGELFLPLRGGGGGGPAEGNNMMPMNGIGMCCRPSAYDDVLVERAVLWYLLLGGRHIDTAALYLNHRPIGRAIQEAMKRGIPRSEIWITTKLWPSQYGYKSALDEILKNWLVDLQVDYIDLVLMHSPTRVPRLPYVMNPLSDECGLAHLNRTMCHFRTWTALSKLRTEGKINNVGVSNFAYSMTHDDDDPNNNNHQQQDGSLASLVRLHDEVDSEKYAPVTVNQMVYNPWISDEWVKTIDYCRQHNIQITGYFTLGGKLQHHQAKTIDVLTKLANKHSKERSVAQIMLRWSIQKGVAVIPGTSNPHHMGENLAVYDAFVLSDDEMEEIDSLRTSSEAAKKFFFMEPSTWGNM